MDLKVLSKLGSGRFWVLIGVVGTLCFLAIRSLYLIDRNVGSPESLSAIKDVAMFLLGAFTTQAANIINSYFGRTDRTPTEGGTK